MEIHLMFFSHFVLPLWFQIPGSMAYWKIEFITKQSLRSIFDGLHSNNDLLSTTTTKQKPMQMWKKNWLVYEFMDFYGTETRLLKLN